jgi:hypothetical protein
MLGEKELRKKRQLFKQVFEEWFKLPDGTLMVTEGIVESYFGKYIYLTPNGEMGSEKLIDETEIWLSLRNFLNNRGQIIKLLLIGRPYEWLINYNNFVEFPQLRYFQSPLELAKHLGMDSIYQLNTLNDVCENIHIRKWYLGFPNKKRAVTILETYHRKQEFHTFEQMLGVMVLVGDEIRGFNPPSSTSQMKSIINDAYARYEKIGLAMKAEAFKKLNGLR